MTAASTSSEATLLTAEDLLRLSDDRRGELIRGVLCEMPPTGQRHGQIAIRLGMRVGAFVEARRLGTVVGAETGVQLERHPDTVRAPDFAYTSYERLPGGAVVDTYAQEVPELVAEVVSPSDRRGDVYDKARMWLSFGVLLVWVVFPASRTVEVHRAGADDVETLTEADSLDGAPVLRRFAYPLSELFAP
ncbi:MAG: Uma2 family endonuclease [Acidimicrobiaceae bacterium]|nr:Uma2 family endonuclease [Acidimicrobiaceae bacterium]MDE0319074.1 Uma2 family endonuclease [Acidimicrobiaceae bacterium]MDE0498495.1 Uma2 family endonuclease [Acidimicrobiaceae bacterium]